MDEYTKKIAEQWIQHATEADKLAKTSGNIIEESFHAFMANAISAAVRQSSHQEVKDLFNKLTQPYC